MLVMVEGRPQKLAAQKVLQANLGATLTDRGVRNIGFPGNNRDERLFSQGQGKLWAVFGKESDASEPRFWNAFGIYEERKPAQTITVEINIATESNRELVSGFFARDPLRGATYLMHDGGVGGGRKGIGRSSFLAWSKSSLDEVGYADGRIRAGIIIGALDSADLTSRIWHFVQRVAAYKAAVVSGELDGAEMQAAVEQWESYNRESSGRRRGKRKSDIDYVSYHGEVVERLFEERSACRAPGEQVFNNRLIDLYVRRGDHMTEIYEVKTSLDRQSIYTAIGQLMSHSSRAAVDVRRILVVPQGPVVDDLLHGLSSLGIALRRFTVTKGEFPTVRLLGEGA